MNLKLNSIGLDKKPSDTKVIVAMSGGVDSSTVAGLMKKKGYNVTIYDLMIYQVKNFMKNDKLKIIKGDLRNNDKWKEARFGDG